MGAGKVNNIFGVDELKAKEKAAEIADNDRRLAWNEADYETDPALSRWLEVFWREYKKMVQL